MKTLVIHPADATTQFLAPIYFKTPEEATDAALLYTLKHLI